MANSFILVTFALDIKALALSYIFTVSNILSLESHIEHIDNKCTLRHCLLVVKEQYNPNIMSYLYTYDPLRNEVSFVSAPYKNFGVGKYFSLTIREDNEVNDKFILVKDNAFAYHSEEQNKDA